LIQQDEALPQYHNAVTRFLNENVPGQWIGCGSPKARPHRLPDLMPMDFSYGGCIIDQVYVPPLPNNLQELKDKIHQALESTDRYLMQSMEQVHVLFGCDQGFPWSPH
jgi:hypothetical protein